MKEALKVLGSLLFVICLQLYLTKYITESYLLDLTMVAVICFARYKSWLQSTLIGSAGGLFQDAVSALPLGMNGFTKTLTGYLVAAISSRLLLETLTTQFLLIFSMTLTDAFLKLVLYRALGASLPARSLPTSLSQAVVTAAFGTIVLAGLRASARWKLTSKLQWRR